MSIPKLPAVRPYLFAGGIVALMVAGKVAFVGLGVGTFNITAWELVLLAVVGAALIALGWSRRTGSDADLEDEIGEDTDTQNEP